MAGLIAAHADWSVDPGKRWMAVARAVPHGWVLSVAPVGELATLFERLVRAAEGGPVALGVDFPIGLPRAFAAAHLDLALDFPGFLHLLGDRPAFFSVSGTLAEVSAARPFYPRRGVRGMTRLSHALALGLPGAADLSRVCDRATGERPAGAPVFWTLGANQSGKAALSAWRDLLLPGLSSLAPPALWPFEGGFRDLLRPGRVAVAETYPAEAMRQLGLRPIGSKRRQADRLMQMPGLLGAMAALRVRGDGPLEGMLAAGFGADAAGEDRFDCVLGVLCVLLVLEGRRPDAAPADPWIRRWEGWVLGQASGGQASPDTGLRRERGCG